MILHPAFGHHDPSVIFTGIKPQKWEFYLNPSYPLLGNLGHINATHPSLESVHTPWGGMTQQLGNGD